MNLRSISSCVVHATAMCLISTVSLAGPARFHVTLDADAATEVYAGRVYVAIAPADGPEPREAMHAWVNPPPLFAVDTGGLEPGGSIVIGAGCLADPVGPDDLPAGAYRAQAVLRVSPDSPRAGSGAGDLYSEPVSFEVTGDEAEVSVALVVDRVVAAEPFGETDRVKLVEFVSPLLSAFHGREYRVQAGVVLPEGFDADSAYPVIYFGTGFGGDHTFAHALARAPLANAPDATPAVWVVPNPMCYRGHSVFANSANNGPWGDVLVEEIAPRIDDMFGGVGPEHRYITGVSSGGWMSLWVQMMHSEAFAGCWSHVPDPVDLHHFQTVDIYAENANIYTASEGGEAPIGRRGDTVFLTARDFIGRETVLGPGGQMHSFEAVWSPRGADGAPVPLWDRATGAIDPEVAEAWKAYDVAHLVRTRWADFAEGLAGKIHVYGGAADTFYLERAIQPLAEAFGSVGSDAEVRMIEGMGHSIYPGGHADMLRTIAERWAARD